VIYKAKLRKISVIFAKNIYVKTKPRKSIDIITLGCSKNLYDSELLASQLKTRYTVTHESGKPSDIVVINTCGFIHDAKQESIDTILEYVELKKRGKIEKIIVTGCLSERYKTELPEGIPEVDAYFGNHHLKEILQYLDLDYRKELIGERLLATPSHYAYLKISEGCDRYCSFCAIPMIRGKHISQPMESLVSEAEKLARKGVKELILIAQDLTFYGLDLYGERKLADLLRQLVRVDGIEWIRLHYLYPQGFPEEILDIMRDEPKICRYLDIPLQHIDDEILRSMRRGSGEKQTRTLLKKIKERVPGVHLRTTFIVGYPGETEEKFLKLLNFVEETGFDRAGVFTYSEEEGTRAYQLPDDVPPEVKEERKNRLMEKQMEISLRNNRRKTGKILPVLIDRREGDVYIGRTEFDSPEVDNEVIIRTTRILTPGKFIRVRITEAGPYDLYGIPAE
jgi:ribosomal protein S12 methylthiotransferase